MKTNEDVESMNPKELESVINHSPNFRYEYFIKKVVDYITMGGQHYRMMKGIY
jgi:hypothetical protein